jgi:hypothetical protein
MTGILGTTSTGDPLELDLDRLIGSHACIVANAGGGKSGLIRRLLEATHGRIQHIVLDVEDEFYSLRERYEYVIAGGDGGDAPATLANAEALAIGALTHSFSLIVQLNDLGPDGAPRFVGRFLDSLITAPRDLWRPVLVVLDEAQRFAPSGGERTEATHGVRALTGQGRKRGFTAILASQRIAKIDPNVRGDVNNWLLGRVGQAIDRNTMADALGFTAKEGRDRFPGLAPRSFWAFGPALADEPTLLRVTDVETTPVRPGQAKVPTPPPPEALRAILAGLAAPGTDEAAQPDLKTGPSPQPDWPDQRAEVATLKAEVDRLTVAVAALQSRQEAALAALQGQPLPALEPHQRRDAPAPTPVPRQPASARETRQSEGGAALEGPQRRILNALGWWKAFGFDAPSNEQVAFIAKYSPNSSGYTNPRGALKSAGYVTYPAPGRVSLTEAGVALAEQPATPPTGDELRRRVMDELAGPQQRILRAVINAYPEAMSNADVAAAAGYSASSSGYTNPRGNLKTLSLIDYPTSGWVRAAGWLFP